MTLISFLGKNLKYEKFDNKLIISYYLSVNKNKHKNMIFKKLVITIIALAISLTSLSFFNLDARSQSIPLFDPNFIMSDETFSSTRVFNSPNSIQAFLETTNGPLKNYTEGGKRASDIIYEAARGITSQKFGVVPQINPGVLMAYLEKEMSLINIRNYDPYVDPQNRMVIAMGYGCPDTAACSTEYYGFKNQLNWAAFQLQFNFDRSEAGNQVVSPYIKGKTFVTLDEYTVTPSNSSTAANYRYTPHVYWGNYNLWKIITANGWGVSSQKFTYAQIDSVNLQNKDVAIAQLKNQPRFISKDEGINLVKKKYSFGQLNDDIRSLQAFLRQEGYYQTREINGRYGTITPSAHKQYRLDKKIIDWVFTSVSATRCESLISREYAIGTENGDILDLQKCLTDIGIFDGNLQTSYYGPVTDSARKAAKAYIDEVRFTQNNTPVNNVKHDDDKDVLNVKLESRYKNYELDGLDCNWLQFRQYRIGMSGQQVYDLQRCLVKWGKMPSSLTTGFYGSITANARVTNYDERTSLMCTQLLIENQKNNTTSNQTLELQKCLTNAGVFDSSLQTGFYGGYTSVKVDEARNILNSNCWVNLFNATYGERSQRVVDIQNCLISFGFLAEENNTGFYGSLTQEALNKATRFRKVFKKY